jgi:hypothetical protein
MMNFGTPNMFITLWFELDYGTNPPLGTLMIWQVQLCMCIWKCCIFVGKNGLKGRSHKFKGANEESRSCSTARWNHSQRWQGPRCYIGAFTRSKAYRTSCEKTPYLKRGDDVAKIMQLKGFKSKMMRGPMWKKGRPNRAKVGLGRSAQAIRPTHFLASVRPPFLEREDDATLSHCGLHHSQRTETSTREVVHKGERLERREIIR